jgi:hypothetical protein
MEDVKGVDGQSYHRAVEDIYQNGGCSYPNKGMRKKRIRTEVNLGMDDSSVPAV